MSLKDYLAQLDESTPEDDPEAALHAHLDSNPEFEATLQRIYGIDPNEAQQPEDQEQQSFEPTGVQSFLERFAGGMQNVQAPRPNNFWEGLAVGGARGLGAAGSRVANARAKFEAQQVEHRKATDAERLKASQAYRAALAGQLTTQENARGAAQTRTTEDQAKYERETHLVQPGDFPGDRLVGQRAPMSFYKPEDTSGGALVKVQGKNGPVWRTKAEALGQPAAADVGASTLSPEEYALLGGLVQQSGTFPSLGRGGIGSPTGRGILGSMLKSNATGQTPQEIGQNLAGQKAAQGAVSGSLKDIEKSLSQQTVFANKLKLNTDRLRATAQKVADLGPRFLNRPIREALGQLGSADQAAYRAALLPVQTESARLLSSGPTLGGQLTDSARRELESIVSGDFNGRQLSAVLDVLENDANNGIDMYTQQRDELRASVRGGTGSAESRVTGAGGPAYKPGGFFDSNRRPR